MYVAGDEFVHVSGVPLETAVTFSGDLGPPDVSSGNQTWVLGKSSSMHSQSLSHHSSHSLYFSVNENDNFRRIYDFSRV